MSPFIGKLFLIFFVVSTCAARGGAQERISFPVGASTKTAGYTPLWAGVKHGFFARQGLDVQPVVIRGSDRAIQALAGGSLE